MALPSWKWLLLPISSFLISYAIFHVLTSSAPQNNNNDWEATVSTPSRPHHHHHEFSHVLKKQIPCGILFAKRSNHVHPLPTVLVDSTVPTSTMSYAIAEEHGIIHLLPGGSGPKKDIIPENSIWLRIDDATVPAPEIRVLMEGEENGEAGEAASKVTSEFSLKLGLDFLKLNRATYNEADGELFVQVDNDNGDDGRALIPFILPKLPFENEVNQKVKDDMKKNKSGSTATTITQTSQISIREQIPCGLVLPRDGRPEVFPLPTVIDTTVASATISLKAAKKFHLLDDIVTFDENDSEEDHYAKVRHLIIPEGSFSLQMDEAFVSAPDIRVVDEKHDTEYDLVLGMFFLKEVNGQMIDGDLYIRPNGENDEPVLIPFIQKREMLSFGVDEDDAGKEEL